MKISFVPVICASIIGVMALSAPAVAQQKTEKACKEVWQANKAANQAAKVTEKAYVTKCRADSAAAKPAAAPAPAAAAPAPKPAAMAPAAAPAKPAVAATGGKAGETTRIKACGVEWKAAKAAGKVPAGQKWPQFWSECDKRMKAAGM
jgi:hypothetical protein